VTNADYHIFGVGVDSDDLRYIGWTQKSIDEARERAAILSDLVEDGRLDPIHSMVEALQGDRISIFEIESVSSMKDATSSVMFWRTYYRALGLDVLVDH
jgi:hypothetical protein